MQPVIIRQPMCFNTALINLSNTHLFTKPSVARYIRCSKLRGSPRRADQVCSFVDSRKQRARQRLWRAHCSPQSIVELWGELCLCPVCAPSFSVSINARLTRKASFGPLPDTANVSPTSFPRFLVFLFQYWLLDVAKFKVKTIEQATMFGSIS